MKKNFKTVEEVAEYLDILCEKELNDIEVDGMVKFLPEKNKYDIYYGTDDVAAIFATEDRTEYIWRTRRDFHNYKYDARVVDNEEIANAIACYPQYIKDGGCLDVSSWLFEEYCDSKLSIDYDVLTTIGRIFKVL